MFEMTFLSDMQLVSTVDYSSMVKQRTISPEFAEENGDASTAFLDALRTKAMDELLVAATEYGIDLKDLGMPLFVFLMLTAALLMTVYGVAVIDRQFKGDIAATMDKLTTRALQAQVEAAVSHPLEFIFSALV